MWEVHCRTIRNGPKGLKIAFENEEEGFLPRFVAKGPAGGVFFLSRQGKTEDRRDACPTGEGEGGRDGCPTRMVVLEYDNSRCSDHEVRRSFI